MTLVRTVALVAGLALAAPATAHAGGYVTVGVSPLPERVAAGQRWSPEVTVLAHGRTPAGDAAPVLVLGAAGRDPLRVPARPTAKPGVYRAAVTLPAPGRWSVSVTVTGWSSTHHFGAIDVGAREAAAAGTASRGASGSPWLPLGLALAAGAAAALAAAALTRRRPVVAP